MRWLREQWRLWLTAVMFYTRVPCPAWVDHSPAALNRATVYFPAIGWLVGGAGAATYWMGCWVLPPLLALLMSTVVTLLLTGAFHEDGLADTADGLGGGWTPQQVMHIMTDSRIGTYGAVALVLALGIKLGALHTLPGAWVPWALVAGHSVSRLLAATLITTHTYVSLTDASKARPVAQGFRGASLWVGVLLGLLPVAVWGNPAGVMALALPLLGRLYLGRMYRRRLGGYTGDALGAAQQVTELLYYLGLVMLNHTQAVAYLGHLARLL